MVCAACGGYLNPVMVELAKRDGFLICMDCIRSRARAVANHGTCSCTKKSRISSEVKGTAGRRQWIACERCLGVIRQIA